MFKFNYKYFLLALLLFITEVLIGAYMHDAWIRPYGGDVLVGILIYCFIKSFVDTPPELTIPAVLIFCYVIEFLQYFNFLNVLGLQDSKLACIVLGNSFSWVDILSYTVGMSFVAVVERSKQVLSKF